MATVAGYLGVSVGAMFFGAATVAMGAYSAYEASLQEAPELKKVDPIVDKTSQQEAEEVEAPELLSEEEKRRKSLGIAQFTIERDKQTEQPQQTTTGVQTLTDVPGVQI